MKKILIVVDYQNDFVDSNGALPVPNADKISQNIQDKIDNPIYDSIIYTFDTHTKEQYEGSDEQEYFPNIHCEFGTKGWNFYKIKPKFEDWNDFIESRTEDFDMYQSANEFFFTKNVFNIWQGNATYPKWFENTFPKDEYEVDVVGVAYEFCCKMNIMGLLERGYTVNFLTDCSASITPDGEKDAKAIMVDTGANLINSKEV